MSDLFSRLQVRSKVWLELDGAPVFGQGREQLLRLIQSAGSINAAAKEMGIPYRKAWTYLDAMETRLGYPLVSRQKGGAGGGNSTLTPDALQLLAGFDALQDGVNAFVDCRFSGLCR